MVAIPRQIHGLLFAEHAGMNSHSNKNQIRGVIWDIDGTLLDSNDAHAQAYAEAFANEGIELAVDDIRRKIGMGGDKLLPSLTGIEQDSERGQLITRRKKKIFEQKYLPHLKPFPKAKKLLETLRDAGLKFAVGTSAGEKESDQFLQILDVKHLVDEKTSSDDIQESKPDPDVVQECLKRLKLKPFEVIMIGDTPYDIEAARRANVQCIAFRSGGWSDQDLKGAIEIYDGPSEFL